MMSEDLTEPQQSADQKLTQILTVVLDFDRRIGILEEKVEQRQYDARPLWEKVTTDIAQLQENQDRFRESQQQLQKSFTQLQEGYTQLQENYAQLQESQERLHETLDSLRAEAHEIRTMLRDVIRRFSIFNDTLVSMQADYRDISDRVRGLGVGHT
jgi:chromosome segregation ATPase